MAGSKQHYIPQALQRGFEAAKSGKYSQVLVFRKGAVPYLSSTEGVAAERHFYSHPNASEVTLDDLITEYERDILSPAISSLRDAPLGDVDVDIGASVVSHLSIRAAFTRGSFGVIGKRLGERLSEVLKNRDAVRALIGVDSNGKSLLGESIDEELANKLPHLPIEERARLAKMFRFRLREHFENDFAAFPGLSGEYMTMFAGGFLPAIDRGHIKALEKELVPAERTKELRALRWQLRDVPQPLHVILPDCVAVSISKADFSEVKPYMLPDSDALAGVLMPVSATRVLVGTRGEVSIDWAALNLVLAKASLEFFISSRKDADTTALAQHIGEAVSNFSHKLVEEGAFLPPEPTRASRVWAVVDTPTRTPAVQFQPADLRTEELVQALQAQMEALELAPYLTCLHELTVTQDVAGLLGDRGAVLNDYGKQQVAFGTCQCTPTEDGFACEVLVPAGLVQLLCDQKQPAVHAAATLIRHHLGRAVYMHFFGQSVTHGELQAERGQLEAVLLSLAQFAASHYFGARLSTPTEMAAEEFWLADSLRAELLKLGFDGLVRARQQFLADRDVDTLLQILALYLEVLLSTVAPATVLQGVSPVRWSEGECAQVLEAFGLTKWFSLLARDMDAYFAAKEAWSGLAELGFLTLHAERLLWGFGFFLSPAGSQIRVDVITDQELGFVSKLLGGTSFTDLT